MGWFSEPKDRIVSRVINNSTRVYYIGDGEWSEAIERAHRFTLSAAQIFLSSIVVSDGQIHIWK